MNTLFVFLPCYNEELNIRPLILSWQEQVELLKQQNINLEIIPIDDYSSDNTRQVINDLANEFINIQLILHDENQGLRGGLNSSISYFIKNGKSTDFMVLMDGDNTHNPVYIFQMIEKIKQGSDCIIASRYKDNATVHGLNKYRVFMSDMARFYYKFMLKVPNVEDYTCGYRLYNYPIMKRLVKRFGTNPIKENSFACMMELLYKIYLVGAKFEEVGFDLRYDNKMGKSKMQVMKTMFKSISTAVKLKFLQKEDY